MTRGPIVDSHLHLWDPANLRYPWLDDNALLNRPFLLSDFWRAASGCEVQAMVFVQCEALPEQFLAEVAWISRLASIDRRIAGIVGWAPLEKGTAVRDDLIQLAEHPRLRGIRRIIQFEADRAFCLKPGFIDGVRTLAEFGLSFDICADWSRMESVVALARAVPETAMVLDHIGKPPIATCTMEPWTSQIRLLADLPHVCCKISGVATEADHAHWTDEALSRYIQVAIDAFGFDRIMFGGDWPVSLQAIEYSRWVAVLDAVLASANEAERRKFWRENAIRFYRLEG